MRYLLIGLVLIGLIGCGSNGDKQSDKSSNPLSPTTKDSSKQPPSIPKI